MTTPQSRFKAHLDPSPGWSMDRSFWKWDPRGSAILSGLFIEYSRFKRAYVTLDLDYAGSASSWMEGGLPEPTVVIINRRNYHCHMLWELKTPVYWPNQYNYKSVRMGPVNLFRVVKHGLETLLSADRGYTNSTVKNPFSPVWITYWADRQYELKYLAEFIPNISLPEIRKNRNDVYFGRNDELFNVMRKKAYKNAFKYIELRDFQDFILEHCESYNETFIPMNWPDRGPLNNIEVGHIAKGIAKWVLQHRYDKNFKQYQKNVGAMKLPPIKPNLPEDEYKQQVQERLSAGAQYTNALRKKKTATKITEAFHRLIQSGVDLTNENIAKESGVSYRTVCEYFRKK